MAEQPAVGRDTTFNCIEESLCRRQIKIHVHDDHFLHGTPAETLSHLRAMLGKGRVKRK